MSSAAVVIGALTLRTLGKIFSRRHSEIFFLFSQKTVFDISCKLLQIVGDNLREMSKPVFWEK